MPNDDRPYPKLSDEEKEHIGGLFRDSQLEGMGSLKLHPSLLDLDQDCFSAYSGDPDVLKPKSAGNLPFVHAEQPPEFISISYNVLDAFALASFAGCPNLAIGSTVVLSCKLSMASLSDPMKLSLTFRPEIMPQMTARFNGNLLSFFGTALETKGIEPGIIFLGIERLPTLWFKYPGQMSAEKSRFLRDRPPELWPTARLTIAVTQDLITRADATITFLRNTPTDDQQPQ